MDAVDVIRRGAFYNLTESQLFSGPMALDCDLHKRFFISPKSPITLSETGRLQGAGV